MRKQVSEKTLELNVCTELLNAIREWSGCERAFWLGMKQFEEASSGLDELLANLPPGRFLGLQFKSPYPSRPDINPYRYSLNELQQSNLMSLSSGGRAVYYVFPNFNTLARLTSVAPNLLLHTYIVPVDEIGHLGAAPQRRHRVDCFEPSGLIRINSPVEIPHSPVAKVFLDQLRRQSEEQVKVALKLVQHSDLKEWLTETVRIGIETRRVGQLLRGFSAVGIPQ
jgi:hypothetical protein